MKNRLILTEGGKGGVGKTLSALTLADYLTTKDVPYTAIDADTENAGKAATFANYLPCTSVNLRSVADCDKLINLAASNHITIADLPANASGDIMPWFEAVITPEVLDSLNLEIVTIGAITPEAGSFASVLQWAEYLQDRVTHVVALNHRFAARVPQRKEEVFTELFQSKIGARFMAAFDPKLIEIPGLYDGTTLLWAKSGKLPSDCARSISILDGARLRQWIGKIHQQWEAAGF